MEEAEVLLYEAPLVELRRSRGVCWVAFGDEGEPLVWTPSLESQMFTAVDLATEDSHSSVVVLASRSQDFCRGADVSQLRARLDNPDGESADLVLVRQVTRLLNAPKLTIAAIRGHCIGIGLALALTCDLRVAHTSARFQSGFARRGLVAEHASAWLLPRIVGVSNALELLLLSETIDAGHAHRIGLVNRVVDDLEGTVARLASAAGTELAPESIAEIKGQIYRGLSVPFSEGLKDSAHAQAASMRSAGAREGIESFLEKRSPRFWSDKAE